MYDYQGCVLPLEIVEYALEWAFDPETAEWVESVRLQRTSSSQLIDFIWATYVTSKCKRLKSLNCPCIKRAKCVFETVLRQSSSIDAIRPWCIPLKALILLHNGTSLEALSKLVKWNLHDRAMFIRAYEILASGPSTSAMCFIIRVFNVSEQDFRRMSGRVVLFAAQDGHVSVLEYLHKSGLRSLDKCWTQGALQQAAENGHVHVLAFLHRTWGLRAKHARSNNNLALKLAAEHRHVKVLEFLYCTFRLNIKDARCDDNYALRTAARNGHVAVLRHLHDVWGLTAEDARYWKNCALRMAAENGHADVLEFLQSAWGLTAEDARSCDNHAMRTAASKGHANVVAFLENM